MHIHKKTFETDPFFKRLSHRMLSFVGQRLRPLYAQTGTCLYRQGDDITTYKILTRGLAAFVHPDYHNQMFALVDPEMVNRGMLNNFKNCGFEDSVMNHLLFVKEIVEKRLDVNQIA